MSEGLAQGPYIAVSVGFKPATFWTQGTELITTELPHPTTPLRSSSSLPTVKKWLNTHYFSPTFGFITAPSSGERVKVKGQFRGI